MSQMSTPKPPTDPAPTAAVNTPEACPDEEPSCKDLVHRAVSYINDHTIQFYFHGYTLTLIMLQEFFPRFQSFIDKGFCFMVAAMNMIAFRDNPSSRIVYAYCCRRHQRHAWLELCIEGVWWVIDPCWFQPGIRLRDLQYAEVEPEFFYVCGHEEFWSYPLSVQMEQKMRHPATSHLFFEFWEYYSWYEECAKPFDPDIAEVILDDIAGRFLHPGLVLLSPEIVLSRRIFNELMTRPQRKRPKAHTIRQFDHFRKLIHRDYRLYRESCPLPK